MKGATLFQNVGGLNAEQIAINQFVKEALMRIAAESPMNAERMRRYLR